MPTLEAVWMWRIEFLDALSDPPEETGQSFWDYLRERLLPRWKTARTGQVREDDGYAVADDPGYWDASEKGTAGNSALKGELSSHWWYDWISGNKKNPYTSFGYPSEQRVCVDATLAALRDKHLDQYETADGGQANVPWMRVVAFLTLDSWSSVKAWKDRRPYSLPTCVSRVTKAGEIEEPKSDVDLAGELRDLIQLEAPGSYRNLTLTPNKVGPRWEISLPTWNAVQSLESWRRQILGIVRREIGDHVNARKEAMKSSGAFLDSNMKKNHDHFRWLSLYQVYDMSYHDIMGTETARSLSTINRAVHSTAEYIGLPLRRQSLGGRPKKLFE